MVGRCRPISAWCGGGPVSHVGWAGERSHPWFGQSQHRCHGGSFGGQPVALHRFVQRSDVRAAESSGAAALYELVEERVPFVR